LLSAFYSSRRQDISQNTVLFYHRCLDKAIGIEITLAGIDGFVNHPPVIMASLPVSGL